MTKAIIFDLDTCLSAADEVGRDLYDPAFNAIRAANRGTVSQSELDRAFEESWRIPFDIIAEKHGFSKEMRVAGWREFAQLTVKKPMRGYGDLEVLNDLLPAKYLVTSGFRRLQESKVDMLGIRSLFAGVYIDGLGEENRLHKEGYFKQIVQQDGLRPSEALIVGDNPDSEIAAGIRLGIRTVQILRPGVTRDGRADHHVHGLTELKGLI
jgi:FMN phosphatase YigB (HAD superfamily)